MAAPVELRRQSLADYVPHIDPAAGGAINTWLDSRDAFTFRLDSTDFRLAWIDAASAQPRIGVEVAFGSHVVLLAVDGFAALNPMLVGDPFTLMPASLRDLAVQRLLARFIALLPPALTEAADIRAIHWQKDTLPDWQSRVGFSLQRLATETTSMGVIAAQSPAGLLWVHEVLLAGLPALRPTHLPISAPLRLQLGQTLLEPDALRGLEAGDVVWIETARLARDGLDITLLAPRGGGAWHCRAKHDSLRAISTMTGETMNAETSTLEIPVTFDLGDLSIPVRELERLQPGRMFELPQDVAEATVNVRVSGKLIAEGKLVVIGRRIGVRISQVLISRESDV